MINSVASSFTPTYYAPVQPVSPIKQQNSNVIQATAIDESKENTGRKNAESREKEVQEGGSRYNQPLQSGTRGTKLNMFV